jgi:hypothetical protein
LPSWTFYLLCPAFVFALFFSSSATFSSLCCLFPFWLHEVCLFLTAEFSVL